MDGLWVVAGLYWFACHIGFAWYLAAVKDRSTGEALAFAILLGPLGLILFALLADGGCPPSGLVAALGGSEARPFVPPTVPPVPAPGRTSHKFTVVLKGEGERTASLDHMIEKAGCSDAVVDVRDGRIVMDFERPGVTLQAVASTAVHQLKRAGLAVDRAERVKPDGEG